MNATKKKDTILTRLRRAAHTETANGLSFDVHIYINRRGNGTIVVNGPQE